MNKKFQRLGFATFLPLLLSSQVMAAQVLASVEPSHETAEASASDSEAKTCVLDATTTELGEGASLVERFGPSSLAELRAASCPDKLDIFSRAILLTALARVEQVEDSETQFTMLMEITGIYQALELPQTLPLLDYLFERSQALEEPGSRLNFAVALAQRYSSFRTDEKIPFPQEQAAMEAAAEQIIQLNFSDDGEISPEQGSDIYSVAHWYSKQDDLAKARQIVSHIDKSYGLEMFQQQLEESYAYALEQAGEQAKADRHRRENLPPESLAIYAEAKAHERMVALAEALPEEGEAIDQDTLKSLQKNVDKLDVPWAKYTYGQMVARQLILQGQYDAALETLTQAPVPEPAEYEYYYEPTDAMEEGEEVDPTTLEIDLGIESASLLPAILATEVAADGYVDEALAFIEHLPEDDSTRLLQRAMLLSGMSVFQEVNSGEAALGDAYLEEAIALAQDLPEQPINASLWFLISLAQRWRSDDVAAEQSMAQAIAIAPALDSVNEEILTELEKDPWILDEEMIAASEQYGSIREFYEALQEKDLEAAEAALAETEDLHTLISMKGTLAAAYSKEEQPDKAKQLLVELLELRTSEELLEDFGDDEYLHQHLLSAFTSSNGHITVLQEALATLEDLEQEQREELLRNALEVYSYSQGYEDLGIAEIMARRDAVLSIEEEDSSLRKQMLRSLATSLANHGHWTEAITFLPEFGLKDQAHGLIALAELYVRQSEKPEEEMQSQLQAQLQDLEIPSPEADEEEEESTEATAAEMAAEAAASVPEAAAEATAGEQESEPSAL